VSVVALSLVAAGLPLMRKSRVMNGAPSLLAALASRQASGINCLGWAFMMDLL